MAVGVQIQSLWYGYSPDGTGITDYVCVEMFHQKKDRGANQPEDEEKANGADNIYRASEEAAESADRQKRLICKRVKRCGFDDNISAVNVLSESRQGGCHSCL